VIEKAWLQDKRWSDRFLPEIKQILGLHLIGEPPVEEDQERNTDLMVLKMDPVRIGCRVRRNTYLSNDEYAGQFTIRAGRPSGVKTELTKVIEGWGDYFFYAFCDEQEELLERWSLCSLNTFRVWFNRQIMKNNGQLPGDKIPNRDNSSFFMAFTFADLPEDFVIADNWQDAEIQAECPF